MPGEHDVLSSRKTGHLDGSTAGRVTEFEVGLVYLPHHIVLAAHAQIGVHPDHIPGAHLRRLQHRADVVERLFRFRGKNRFSVFRWRGLRRPAPRGTTSHLQESLVDLYAGYAAIQQARWPYGFWYRQPQWQLIWTATPSGSAATVSSVRAGGSEPILFQYTSFMAFTLWAPVR